jgi:hypothetical protein
MFWMESGVTHRPIELGSLGRVVENFTGVLHRPIGDLIGVWVRIEHEEYEPSAPKVTLLHSELAATFGMKDMLSDHDTYDCYMTCLTPFSFPIGFWGIRSLKSSGDKIELDVSGYDLGVSGNLLPLGEEITVMAYLTRGRLSGWRRSLIRRWDGAIAVHADMEKSEVEKEEIIEWEDASGTTTLRMQHEYEDARIGENKTLVQIARPAMVRTFKADTQNDLKNICLMLSLASREKIQWYEISVETYKAKERPRLSPRAKRRTGGGSSRYPEQEDPLIEHRDLVNGGFKNLLELFQSCPHSETLKRAIAFEVASRGLDGGLESNYILCYSALEAIASEALTDTASLPRYQPAQWRELMRTLETTIADFGQSHGLSPILIGYTQKRLRNLARPAIADILLHLTRSLGIKTDDLWPTDVTFEEGLRAALRIRNSLVHRAVIIDLIAMHDNLARLQALAERFMLKLIGWPENKVWVWADQPLKRVNKS